MKLWLLTMFLLGSLLGSIIMYLANPARGADLPPLIRYGTSKLPIPPKYKLERCVVTGNDGYPGQVIQDDKTCKSGLRWIYLE